MKKPTDLKVILSLPFLKDLVRHIEENKLTDSNLSNLVELPLCYNTDDKALRVDIEKAGQHFSSYQDCRSTRINLK